MLFSTKTVKKETKAKQVPQGVLKYFTAADTDTLLPF